MASNDFAQWLRVHDVSHHEAAARLRCSTSTVFKVANGGVPSLLVAAKIEAMTDGEVTFADLLPRSQFRQLSALRDRCADLRCRERADWNARATA